MIFNPYQLTPLTDGTATAASQLHWAMPLLQDNELVVALLMLFIAADVMAWCHKGVMPHQMKWITDTRNARTFESTVVIYPWLKAVLLVQLFLSFGLALYCIYDDAPGLHLQQMQSTSMWRFVACMGALLGWFLLQLGLIRWLCYIFDVREKRTIMLRSYLASFVVIAPLATLCLVCLIAGLTSQATALNLLGVLFIISQISFIYNGFKIFCDGFGSICLIFAYLCALEIAPLLVLWAKFATH